MPDKTANIYRFASLRQYSFKQRFVIRAADLAFYVLIKFIGGTVRFETRHADHLNAIDAAGKTPIYATWHDRIFLGTYSLKQRGIVFLASQSMDGEYIARFLQRFGFGIIRGSSTRGGARGLVEMIRVMKSGIAMGITVDGPKGPRHEVKPGAVLLAKKTGNPILPFIVEPRKYWTIGSWDRLQIPRPFTSAIFIFGEPLYVNADADESQILKYRDDLQKSLDDLATLAAGRS